MADQTNDLLDLCDDLKDDLERVLARLDAIVGPESCGECGQKLPANHRLSWTVEPFRNGLNNHLAGVRAARTRFAGERLY